MCWATGTFLYLLGSKAEGGLETPVALVAALPVVILKGEENGLGTTLGADGVDSLLLVLGSAAGLTVAATARLPASLQVDDGLVADTLKDGDLLLDKGTSAGGVNVGVEVGVDVGANNVNSTADGLGDLGALPDVDGLGNGDGALVGRALRLDVLDELGEGGSTADTVEQRLVGDDEKADSVPLVHGVEGIDLLLDLRVVDGALLARLDEDASNDLETLLDAGRDDVLEGAAVSAVDTDSLETGAGNLSNVLGDLVSRLAGAGLANVGGVGDAVVVVGANDLVLAARGRSRGAGLGLSRSLRGGGLRDGSLLGGSGDGDRSGLGGGGGKARAGVRADGDVVGLGGGHDNLGLGVGTRGDGGGRGVDNDGLGLAGGGVGTDGVGAGAGADVLGHANGAGGDIASGLDGGDGAGDGGLGGDNGGDAADGVSTRGNLGGGGTADGGGVSDGQGRGREGVGAGRRAVLDLRGGNDDDGRGLNRLGGDGSGSRGDGDGRGAGRGGGHGGDGDGDHWAGVSREAPREASSRGNVRVGSPMMVFQMVVQPGMHISPVLSGRGRPVLAAWPRLAKSW